MEGAQRWILVSNAAGVAILAVAIYVVFQSPRKFQTLLRMAVALIATVVVTILSAALLEVGNAEVWAHNSGFLGLLVGVIVELGFFGRTWRR